jgi:hypothetical protein
MKSKEYYNDKLLSIITVFLLFSCHKDSEVSSLPVRTVIVYMIADNNLDNFAVSDINEMEQGWDSKLNGNLIVYVDRAQGAGVAHPVVYKITHDTTSDVVSPVVNVYAEQNSADAGIMYQILSDIITDCPAENYGLILWSHGTGWLPAGATTDNQSKQIVQRSFGRDNDNEMNIFELKVALPRHFDFIIFDACYMGTIEVIYELGSKADYILSSATEILSAGYPYQNIIKELFYTSINYSDVANIFFQSYATLEGAMQSASVSVVKTSELLALTETVRKIMNSTEYFQYVNNSGIQQLSTYSNGLLFDFNDFIKQISTNTNFYNEFNMAISKAVIYKASTGKILDNLQINAFSGMSVFIPDTSNIIYHDFYKNFEWYQNSLYSNYFDKCGFTD